ncbi:EcsC family protein [Dyella sedimenti]|uniref:EcsC family protein n=1 Tax=Dyella sedimenti TaxID=2919947 RepID=UPI001FAA935B|nr:EcsC family protein [Dyella sedimenti]
MSKPASQLPAVITDHSRVTQAILDFVSEIPGSRVEGSPEPEREAQRLAARAAQRAALTAGSLALPPGPLGWLTVLPELIAIWKIQAQMVSDIAAAYGKHSVLGREQMLWCLFRHTAAQAFRDLVVRVGDRLLFRRITYTVAERIAKTVGIKVTQRAVGNGLARWLPVAGAVGVGTYAYYDTRQVARTAIAMFSGAIETAEGDTAATAG